MLLGTFASALVGFRILLLTHVRASDIESDTTRRDAETRHRKAILLRSAIESGRASRSAYQWPYQPFLSRKDLDDLIQVLLQVQIRDLTRIVDIGRTIEAALATPERLRICYHARPKQNAPLVLVAREHGTNPLLADARLVARQLSQLRLSNGSYEFDFSPNCLFDTESGDSTGLHELLRIHPDAPLVIFGHALKFYGAGENEQTWLDELEDDRRVLWVDSAPKSATRLLLERCPKLAAIHHVPFSKEGLRLGFAALSRDEKAPATAVNGEAGIVVSLSGGALRAWAAAAAVGGAATWDQLEELRRGLPEVSAVIPAKTGVMALLEWMRKEAITLDKNKDHIVVTEGGLAFSRDFSELLIRQLRTDAAMPNATNELELEPLEIRARCIYVSHIRIRPDDHDLTRLEAKLELAKHMLVLDPAKGLKAARALYRSELGIEAMQIVELERERETSGYVLPGRKLPAEAPVSWLTSTTGVAVDVFDLFRGDSRTWRRATALALVVMTLELLTAEVVLFLK